MGARVRARRAPRLRRGPRAVVLFSPTLFVGAALVLLAGPMCARSVLPLFGSAPAVWTTSLPSLRTVLAAYASAHERTRRPGGRRRAAVHLGPVWTDDPSNLVPALDLTRPG